MYFPFGCHVKRLYHGALRFGDRTLLENLVLLGCYRTTVKILSTNFYKLRLIVSQTQPIFGCSCSFLDLFLFLVLHNKLPSVVDSI